MAVLSKKFSFWIMYDCIIAASALILFVLLYRGYQWTILAIGLMLIATSFLKIILLTLVYYSGLSIPSAVFSILYIVFGFYFLQSRDVRTFVKSRETIK
jgi:hypothetical protein